MPLVVKDRVRETSTTTGTGTVTLNGAVSNFQSFSAIGDGNTTYYTITLDSAGEWEVGIGTYTASGTTLSRDVVLESSNGGTLVPFSAGTKNVFCTYPAEASVSDGKTNVIEVSSTDAALRITQLGTGNALLVEDEANPDSSPFVVNADGRVIVGTTQPAATYGATTPYLQVRGTDISTSAGSIESNSTTASRGGTLFLARSRSTTIGGVTAVQSGDRLAAIAASGADGTGFIQAALITAEVDGTPDTNDMPGRLVFSTTADGASSPTERMRIDSSGVTTLTGTGIINANSTTDAALRITQLGTGNALVVEDEANPDSSPFVIDASGNVISGTTAVLSTRISTTSITPSLQQVGENLNSSNIGVFGFGTNPGVLIAKSNGTIASPTAVVSGNLVGRISAAGYDGNNFTEAVRITAEVDGTPGTNDMPGRLVFSTTADGGSLPTERMRISSTGKITASAGTNWAGTVSQNGSSAIFERGSNANGEFVKYADGTMICFVDNSTVPVANTLTSSSHSWPATFSAAPILSCSPNSGVLGTTLTAFNARSATTTGYSQTILRSNTTSTSLDVIAVGRWY